MAKIILVEDDPTMLYLLSTLFKIEGFQVVNSSRQNSENILQTIQQEKPDLALIDVYLKESNGFDLLKHIKGDPDLRQMRTVMTSGMDYRVKCLRLGADEFILKPYVPDELIRVIHETLGNSH